MPIIDHPPQRNDPCPCGSGKKYKKCCMFKNYEAPGLQDTVRARLITQLFDFAMRRHKEVIPLAYSLFWNDQPPDATLPGEYAEFTEINFNEWFLFDYIVEHVGCRTLIDLYRQQAKNLSDKEEAVLNIFKDSVLSLYEVQDVLPEQGLILQDLLMGGEYVVKEKMGTRGVIKWDIFAARLLLIDGRYIISGSIYPFPARDKQYVIDALLKECSAFRKEKPLANLHECLKVVGFAFNDIWYDMIRTDRRPGILTRTGEPFMLCKAEYVYSNRKAVVQLLKKSKILEESAGGGFIWLEEPDTDSSTILAMIHLKRGKLILECVSRTRLKMGKELLQETLGVHIVHLSDEIKDPYEAIDAKPAKKKIKYNDEIPEEFKQQFYEKFMREHMTKWLDTPIPALDDMTPRECVKTITGQAKVIDLLKYFENIETRKKQNKENHIDLAWVWQELELQRPE